MMSLPVLLAALCLTSVQAGRWININVDYYNDLSGFDYGLGPIDKTYIRGEAKACQSLELYLLEDTEWNNYARWQIYYYASYTALLDTSTYITYDFNQDLSCNEWKPFWFSWSSGTFSMGYGLEPGTNLYLSGYVGSFPVNAISLTTGESYITGEWRWLIDEPPLFNAPSADGNEVLYIAEDTAQYTVVYTPGGSDPENDAITFSTVGDNSDIFAVYYGSLYTMTTLDYETKNTYFVTFQADDGRNVVKTGLLIKITNVIDITPVVTAYSISIPEELPVGTDIGRAISVVDEEEDDSWNVYYDGSNIQYVDFDTQTYVFTIAQRMDIDAGSIDLSGIYVVAMDSVYNYDYKYLSVNVYDINDNVPVFSSEYYDVAITDGTTAGAAVITVAASDSDITNGGLTTSLISQNGATSGFSFSLNSFDLSTSTTIDYEALESVNFEYVLVLMVVDSPTHGDPLSSTAVVRVMVNPVNEATPAWTSSASYTASVPEDTPLTTVVVTLDATDSDLGPDGQITYSIRSVSPCKLAL